MLKAKIIASLKRALWTMGQTALPLIPIGTAVWEVNWLPVIGVCLTSGVASFIKSMLATPPETALYEDALGEPDYTPDMDSMPDSVDIDDIDE